MLAEGPPDAAAAETRVDSDGIKPATVAVLSGHDGSQSFARWPFGNEEQAIGQREFGRNCGLRTITRRVIGKAGFP